MESDRFDRLTRIVGAAGSRRRLLKSFVLGGLALTGLQKAEAASCRAPADICRKNGDCCSGTCGPKDSTGRRRCQCNESTDCPSGGACQQATCIDGICGATLAPDDSSCVATGGKSGTCAGGLCIDRQGTCPAGGDVCLGNVAYGCNGSGDCFCGTTMEGATACVFNSPNAFCGQCTSSAECESGSVCMLDTGENACPCPTGSGYCEPFCS